MAPAAPRFHDPRPSQETLQFTAPADTVPAFSEAAFAAAPGTEASNRFQPLPKPTGEAPYHLDLKNVLTAAGVKRIQSSGRMVFHCFGDTGGVKHPQYQEAVVAQMEADFEGSEPADRPVFFYHLGDVVYFVGAAEEYFPQFYDPYRHYPVPIFAIPGNHDGDVFLRKPAPSLAAFVDNFCAREAHVTPDALEVTSRKAMIQPNVYWTLETPFATFVGLYTNVPEHGVVRPDQQAWFLQELKTAPKDKALLVALHHPVYSADNFHSGSPRMKQLLEQAFQEADRIPDAVLSGHVHNYQRFTRPVGQREVPYIVAGAGGYYNLHKVGKKGTRLRTPVKAPDSDAILESYCDDRHGLLRLTLTAKTLTGEYLAVGNGQGPAVERTDSFTLDLQTHRLIHGRLRGGAE